MRKQLLIAGALVGLVFSIHAQTVLLSQNFESSLTSMPTGWHQQNPIYDPTNKGWEFNNAYTGTYLSYNFPVDGSYFAYIDDDDYNASNKVNHDTLYSPVFSAVGYNHLFCSFDMCICGYCTINGELATLIVSSDGGHTWNTLINFPSVNGWTTETINLDAFANMPNLMIGITYDDYGNDATGLAVDNIEVFAPLDYDMGVTSVNQNYLLKTNTAYNFSGVVHNYGGDSITAYTMNYSVNGGPALTDNISSILINGNGDYTWTHNLSWTPATSGNYVVKFWGNNLNLSNTDQKHSNDTLTTTFVVVNKDSLQAKQVLTEEFMGNSCSICLEEDPHFDSVLGQVVPTHTSNPIRYHVGGADNIENVTSSFTFPRGTYYNVMGLPDSRYDGSAIFSPGSVTKFSIDSLAAIGSPFKITITSADYNTGTGTYTASAVIKSYGAFASGLIARAVLTVDTIDYGDSDQNLDIPPSEFPYPFPYSDFQYTTNYPDVAENMFPDANGTTLGAFTEFSTQTLNFNWKADHPWSSDYNSDPYDSLHPGTKITVFIQTDTGSVAERIAPKYVYQSASVSLGTVLGIQQLSENTSFGIYPNPANGDTHIDFTLGKAQNVNIDVYDMLGQTVFSDNMGMASGGHHVITIPTSNLSAGTYLVRFATDKAVITRKLAVQ